MKKQIGIIGISGRMGKALSQLISEDDKIDLLGGINNKEAKNLQSDISTLIEKADVVIDFSSPSALKHLLAAAIKHNTPLIIGTTGYNSDQLTEISNASKLIPILLSFNFSLGIAICKKLTKIAAEQAGNDFKIDIEETHHVNKKDKPSGTAIVLKEATEKDVPISSIRRDDVIGIHKVHFTSDEEVFEISHKALTRNVFAKGAIACAKYIIDKPAKLYSIDDIFN